MGRSRQKAKQTKVARKLKYFSPDTNLDALQRELAPLESHPYEEYKIESPEEDEDLYPKYMDSAQEGPEGDSPELGEEFWISPKKWFDADHRTTVLLRLTGAGRTRVDPTLVSLHCPLF